MLVEHIWRRGPVPALPEAVVETLSRGPGLIERRFADPWPDGSQDMGDYLDRDARGKVIRAMRDDANRGQDALKSAAKGNVANAFERWDVVFGHRTPGLG